MPRTPADTNTSAADAPRGTVEGLSLVKPPKRKREGTVGLSKELLDAIRENISADEWLSNGEEYADKKPATRDARIYRRDTAAMLHIEEREIRTRVWENTDEYGEPNGSYSFGLKLRTAQDADDDEAEDVPEGDEDENGKEDAA